MGRNYLIVAADGQVREALSQELRRQGFNVTLAENGAEARRVVQSVSVGSVLVESHLPDMSADELQVHLKEIRPDCRVVVLTNFGLVRNSPEQLRFGRNDYLMASTQLFSILQTMTESEGNLRVRPWEERGNQALLKVIDVLVGLLELEHSNFSSSSHQAMQLARATAEEMSAADDLVHEVVLSTLLRDVSKTGMHRESEPDLSIDAQPSEDEIKRQQKKHVASGLRLFEHIAFPWKVLPVIRHHHERYDGSGVPDGLRGREIPMGARIVAVVDAYVSMLGHEENESTTPERALEQLVRGAGHEFDPEVVEAFHRVIDKRLTGRRSKGKPVVLVMDSDSEFRRLLKMRLHNEGFAVKEAPDYEKCLSRLLKSPPDLALIDIDADPAEAFQLLAEMQHDDKLCRIPLAFTSQRASRLHRIRALRNGVDDFLSKGDDMEELIARVQNILIRESVRADGEARRSRRGISGSLENLGLPDIVQTLVIGMKTACVSLTSGRKSGKIWFENGAPRHAKTSKVEGEAAFYEMVRWSQGDFVIEHGTRTKNKTIAHDAMFLLMEGLRLMDEESAGENPTVVAS